MQAPTPISRDAARALLQTWRSQPDDDIEQHRLRVIDALERRIAAHRGTARQLLEDRLNVLIGACADARARSLAAAESACQTDAARPVGALSGLLQYATALTTTDAERYRSRYPVLDALDDFRDLWSGLNMRRQLRQSLEPATTDAGPLNSGRLTYRALTLMRTLSPGYLQQFLAHIDLLSWMQQLNEAAAPPARQASGNTNSRKRARTGRSK